MNEFNKIIQQRIFELETVLANHDLGCYHEGSATRGMIALVTNSLKINKEILEKIQSVPVRNKYRH